MCLKPAPNLHCSSLSTQIQNPKSRTHEPPTHAINPTDPANPQKREKEEKKKTKPTRTPNN
jgi:hypothetical protein